MAYGLTMARSQGLMTVLVHVPRWKPTVTRATMLPHPATTGDTSHWPQGAREEADRNKDKGVLVPSATCQCMPVTRAAVQRCGIGFACVPDWLSEEHGSLSFWSGLAWS